MVVSNPDIFTHISNFRKKPLTLELENHYGQLGEIRDADNLVLQVTSKQHAEEIQAYF